MGVTEEHRHAGGDAEDFEREKLRRSIGLACAKRPVSSSEIEALVDRIEDTLSRSAGVEIPAAEIGEMVMEGLKPLDRVAYIRYGSVYRNFQDIEEFQEMVDELTVRDRLEVQARFQAEIPFRREGVGSREG